MNTRPEGFVTVSRFTGDDGRIYTPDEARQFGWIKDRFYAGRPPGWGIGENELCLGPNLFTDAGRQLLAYCFGFQAPVSDYVVATYGLGTGSAAPKVTDVDLQNPLALASANGPRKAVDGVVYNAPFIASVLFTLASGDANGNLITELGLYAGNGTLYARRTTVGLNKSSEFSPQLSWRIRF